MITKENNFLIYCMECYKNEKNLSGGAVYNLFTGYGVWDYIKECYGALHTTGEKYIIDDIDGFIGDAGKR